MFWSTGNSFSRNYETAVQKKRNYTKKRVALIQTNAHLKKSSLEFNGMTFSEENCHTIYGLENCHTDKVILSLSNYRVVRPIN